MSLTHPDTPVSQQDLKDFYDKIKPYMGIYPSAIANKFSKGDLYSTEERMIGQWIDKKPLYQKVVTGTVDNYSSIIYHDVGATIDKVINFYGVVNGTTFIPNATNEGASARVMIRVNPNSASSNQNKWCVYTAPNGQTAFVGYSYHLVIQYTKTTDSAISIGSDTDYSTEEKIVGTWIDGKPIYQKTIVDTMPTVSTDKTKASKTILSDSSIDKFISTNGFIENSSGVYLPFPIIAGGSSGAYPDMVGRISTANSPKQVNVQSWSTSLNSSTCYVTIQYTKV